MRRKSFFRLAFIVLPFLFNAAEGQSDPFTYAVTSVNKGGTEWIALRKLDTRTGTVGDILLNLRDKDQQPGYGSSVAAIAFDPKNNRIFYSPMNNDQLSYIDLSTMENKYDPGSIFQQSRQIQYKE